MRNRTYTRRTATFEPPPDPRHEAILEFVFNDEEDALCNEEFVLSHQREMPAIQEYLEEMSEIDSRGPCARFH